MRFSISAALATAVLATDAAAWQSYSSGWRWSGHGNGQNNGVSNKVVYKTVTVIAGAAPTTLVRQTRTAKPVEVEVKPTQEAVVEKPAAEEKPATEETPASSGSSGLNADQKAALDAHNAARSEVGTAALTWDEGLAKDAQEWADHLASIGSMTHSQGSGQGENLYMSYGSGDKSPFASASKMWIDEKSSYSGQGIGEGDFGSYGHYTQIVWSSTTKVGMAVASGSSGTYVVARYTPAGNYIGKTPF